MQGRLLLAMRPLYHPGQLVEVIWVLERVSGFVVVFETRTLEMGAGYVLVGCVRVVRVIYQFTMDNVFGSE